MVQKLLKRLEAKLYTSTTIILPIFVFGIGTALLGMIVGLKLRARPMTVTSTAMSVSKTALGYKFPAKTAAALRGSTTEIVNIYRMCFSTVANAFPQRGPTLRYRLMGY